MSAQIDIIYTKVDEAPELASGSFLPKNHAFTAPAGITIGTKDISLAGRILAQFPDRLTADQFQSDDLTELGRSAPKVGQVCFHDHFPVGTARSGVLVLGTRP